MGVTWSSQAATEEDASTTRKRQRDSDDFVEPPGKKKRRTISGTYDSISDSISDTVGCWITKGFLIGAEWVARNAKHGEEKDVITLLLQMMDYFQSYDLEILRRGWRVLYACSKPSRVLPETNDLENDIAVVLATMKTHSASIKIQLLGCRALRSLIMSNDEDWGALCRAEAIPVFLDAVRSFPDNLVMQGLAITFVAVMVREEGDQPRRQTIRNGGIPLILNAMRMFENDPRLLHTGCYALHQLGFVRSSRASLISHGGIDILLRSLQLHKSDSSLVDLCLSALSKLSDDNNMEGRFFAPLALEFMEAFPNDNSIQGHCLVLILRVIGREPVPHRSSIGLTIAAMQKFPDSASLQFFACATLREILQRTRGTEALELISSGGGIECVLTAVKNHKGIFGLQPMALLVLMQIFEQLQTQSPEATTAFGGSDHVIAIVTNLHMDLFAGDAN